VSAAALRGWKAAESGQIEVVRTVEAVCDVSARELIEPLASCALSAAAGSSSAASASRSAPVVLVGVVAADGVD